MHLSFKFEEDLEREFSNASGVKTPIFMMQDGVTGNLEVEGMTDGLLDDRRATIEVILEGFMMTDIDTCVDSHQELRVMVDKKSMSVCEHARITSSSSRRYPFNFNVQSWLEQDQNTKPHHRLMSDMQNSFLPIPPSLRHEVTATPRGMPRPRAAARVTYKLTARILRNRKSIEQIVQPILLLLSSGPAPPICMTDFKGEFRPSQCASIKGPFLQRLGDLNVIAHEPKQFNVKADSGNSLVELPLKLQWTLPKGETLLLAQQRIDVEVKWQFRFSTFVSMLEQRGPPTLKQALVSPATAFVRSSLDPREMRTVWRDWRPAYDEGTNTLESEQSLWLSFPSSEILTPSFWSPFLSRRYSIRLQIKATAPGTAKFDMEVPIQVGVESTPSSSSNSTARSSRRGSGNTVFEEMEGDEQLPQYSV